MASDPAYAARLVTTLHVLGSGSKGNAFAVTTAAGVVLVDAGFGPKALTRRAARAGLDLEALTAIILTHEHGDHATGAAALAARHRVPILCTAGTWHGLGRPGRVQHVLLPTARPIEHGGVVMHATLTTHDATEPIAVALDLPGGVRVAFATDIGRSTTSVRYLLRDAHAVVLESNYDELLLRTGRYPPSVQQRIAGSGGHLSNRGAADLLATVCHDALDVVVLAHLSQQCNTPERARATVEPALRARGFAGELYVAEQEAPLPALRVRAGRGPGQGELALRWDAAAPAPSGSASRDPAGHRRRA